MKVLTAPQLRDADAHTIEHEPIASIDLMERASSAFVHWFVARFKSDQPISIMCGTGNNGGDGLAIARLLSEKEYQVITYVVRVGDGNSPDFAANFERLKNVVAVHEITETANIPNFQESTVIIDAIFGSGLTRPVTGLFSQVIATMNTTDATKIAVDIASGLFSEQPGEEEGAIAMVDFTVTFQVPKLAFFLPQNAPHVGEWVAVDIGLDKNFIQDTKTPYEAVTHSVAQSLVVPRNKYDHKGTYGRALLVSGSFGKMGATVLSARACLSAGVGLVTTHVPRCGYEIIQTSVPENMTLVDETADYLSQVPDNLAVFDAIGVGPGIDTRQETVDMLRSLLSQISNPMVLDADALNILGEHRELLELIPPHSILTPHPKEFERMAGSFKDDYQRLNIQLEFSQKYRAIVVVKGAHSTITTPEGNVYFNTSGNPGMATAGSGDVLTGIITSLLAQSKDPQSAALLGIYLHGLAGDIAAEKMGMEALTASKIIDYLSAAYLQLHLKT